MSDQAPVAAPLELGRGEVERIVERPGIRLEQEPAPAPAQGDRPELAVVHATHGRGRQLAAGKHAHRHSRTV